MNQGLSILLQTAAVVVLSVVVALLVNIIRADRLPLVMPFPPQYQCPSRISEGLATKVEDALRLLPGKGGGLFVDARSREAFEKGHIQGAVSLPYSFLDPLPEEALESLQNAAEIIVYCNSSHSERSRLMAGELSEAGLKHVSYLEGGFWGWVKAQGSYTGKKPEDYE